MRLLTTILFTALIGCGPAIKELTGEQGEQGKQGKQGEQGEQGVQGIEGDRGPRGKAGKNAEGCSVICSSTGSYKYIIVSCPTKVVRSRVLSCEEL